MMGDKKQFSEKLKTFLKLASLINSTMDIKLIKERAINVAASLLHAEVASLLFVDKSGGLYFDVAIGEKGDKIKRIYLKKGQGIAGWVAENNKSVIIKDVKNDPRFFKDADKMSGFVTRNMVCVPVKVKDKLIGVIQVINKINADFTEDDKQNLEALSNYVAVAVENARLYEELKETLFRVVEALAEAIGKRDPYTGGHSQRVKQYSMIIGEYLGLSKDEMVKLRLAATLHDIGKIGIPDRILLKQARLDKEEYEIIKKHTVYGAEILEHVKQLKDVIPGVKYHHERYDGKGYPDGLKGDKIPFLARIIAVADTFDAMTTDRPYRKALTDEVAIKEIEKMAGIQFDKVVCDAFVKAYKDKRTRKNEN